MKQIKFRGWRGRGMHDHQEVLRTLYNLSTGSTLTAPIITMQFIGMQDKNEVDIYEGDIMKTDSGALMVVEYREDMAMFVCRFKSGASMNVCPSWEVIGNIHEHSYLLT